MRFTTQTKYGPVHSTGEEPMPTADAERLVETVAVKQAGLVCPDCGGGAKIIDSSAIYGTSYGPVFACAAYPACDTYVGVHRGTLRPKGTLAGPELRAWRKRAHAAFDPLWQSGTLRRKAAYEWLRESLGVDQERAHIAMLTVEECRKLIELCKTAPPPGSGEYLRA